MSPQKKKEWSSTPRARRKRKPLTVTLSDAARNALDEAAEHGAYFEAPDDDCTSNTFRTFKSRSEVLEFLIETYL